MPRLQTTVEVSSKEDVVVSRFSDAADDPSMVVSWFTSADSVRAQVEPLDDRSWDITVKGPGFGARGTGSVAVISVGSEVNIDLDIKPKGFLGAAAVLAAVASGQVESEIRKTLWREFGRPGENETKS